MKMSRDTYVYVSSITPHAQRERGSDRRWCPYMCVYMFADPPKKFESYFSDLLTFAVGLLVEFID